MLHVEGLSKSFKTTQAVDNVSLNLQPGESVGLLGPNGAGKSTTISMMSTLLAPSSGKVLYKGQDVLKKPEKIRKDLGVVPQEIALYEELTAYENMKFFGRVYGLKGKALENKVDQVLDMVGLLERKKERIKNYSGGMKRRINIAVSLIHEPDILIMDEPTVGIDPQSRRYILDMVRRLNREENMTVLYTSHYMEEVEALCDRIYVMDHGQIIASGTKEELKSILSGDALIMVNVKKQSSDFVDQLSEHAMIEKVSPVEKGYQLTASKGSELFGDIFDCAKEANVTITGIHVKSPTLEDVFLHLTGRKLRD
ncbi:ABC-2 type transport system ATP-binding protein [Pelagirhabdus alkalitolerans]|uniref:ABC-2 type transport system ATP-binding protein n=1 Tax=Pelagirhabdus alkalitolerans TaxID=1612202 RepID=A0A1G6JPG5_9BACI|nr:ABC transporter ATP-binding protein [Pelagirhabdus alkalitolerans]SDC20593.1 ABC-2 type transport system ATP-binding protein [Pelagirhabdus alkalitolerans]